MMDSGETQAADRELELPTADESTPHPSELQSTEAPISTMKPSSDQPSRVHFTGLRLLSSKTSRVTNDPAILGRLIQETTSQASETNPVVNAVIPMGDEESIRLIDTTTNKVSIQFTLKQVVCCAKGSSSESNRSVLITQVKPPVVTPMPMDDAQLTQSESIAGEQTTLPTGGTLEETGDVKEFKTRKYLTHVVQCRTTYEASRLLYFIGELLARAAGKQTSPLSPEHGTARLRLVIDFREEDKGNESGEWKSVPKEKSEVFKLRSKTDKRLWIGMHQTSGLAQVRIDSCLDVSVAYGRYVSDSEMTRLETEDRSYHGEAASTMLVGASFAIPVNWPTDNAEFHMFDEVTDKDECIFFTLVVRMMLSNVEKPVSLSRICRARVFRSEELLWLMADRRPVVQDYTVYLTEFMDEERNLFIGRFVEAVKVIPFPATQTTDSPTNAPSTNGANGSPVSSEAASVVDDEDQCEPLMSGHGEVSQEVTDDQLLLNWGALIPDWHAKVKVTRLTDGLVFPGQQTETSRMELLWNGTAGPQLQDLGGALSQRIKRLVRGSVPDALRAEIWSLLASCPSGETELLDVYRILITKPCKHDAVIQRDLTRTFPAHNFFRERTGQDCLFQVSRAYSLYDEEVGYCQGLSFFAAVLLLHMPVEQAFTLMVKVNNLYGVRELFLDDFDGLHMRLYQLERILQDQMPDLARHFNELGLEPHMYASQWFLTLFTAKFPLPLVFHIVDLFLTEGMIFIFKVALSILRLARRNLLGLDFEGVLKYLRINIPKRFVDTESGGELLTMACVAKVTPAKMLKYALEWQSQKAAKEASESPMRKLELQVVSFRNQILRLEHENEVLAADLLNSKTSMHRELEKLEDKADILTRELFNSRQDLHDALEEKSHLQSEVTQVKQMLRTTLQTMARERGEQQNLLAAYRAIAADLSKRSHTLEQANDANSTPSAPDANTPTDSAQPNGLEPVALYLRLLWVLLQQASECDSCGPAVETFVTEWNKSAGSDLDGDKLVEEFLVDNNLVSSTTNETVELHGSAGASTIDPADASAAHTKSDRFIGKPKRWLEHTLSHFRQWSIIENSPSVIPDVVNDDDSNIIDSKTVEPVADETTLIGSQ